MQVVAIGCIESRRRSRLQVAIGQVVDPMYCESQIKTDSCHKINSHPDFSKDP